MQRPNCSRFTQRTQRTPCLPLGHALTHRNAPPRHAPGHYVSLLSMQNKENYAKMHDYGFRWSIQQMKNDMWGPWNKIGALLTTLEAVSENDAEWIMWCVPCVRV